MIALLRGTPVYREVSRCVLDVQGVGYEVYATNRAMDTWFRDPEPPVEIHVVTHVREDAITLYGFDAPAERQVFTALMGVSGVGPKVALATLDAFTPGELARAVETSDIATLSRIQGVGKKTAQRLALELKGKIAVPVSVRPAAARPRPAASADALPLALERLGYTKAEIARAVDGLAAEGIDPETPVSERLRAALRLLYAS